MPPGHIAFIASFRRHPACGRIGIRKLRKDKMTKVIRDKLGPIPDDHFENEPTFPAKNVTPLSQEWLDYIEAFRSENEEPDKYKPGDNVTGY